MRVTGLDGRPVDVWRACGRKCTYPDRRTAKRYGRPYGHRPYRCPVCGLWHLTSHWRHR